MFHPQPPLSTLFFAPFFSAPSPPPLVEKKVDGKTRQGAIFSQSENYLKVVYGKVGGNRLRKKKGKYLKWYWLVFCRMKKSRNLSDTHKGTLFKLCR
jgi:hypothetical protein